MGIDYNLEMAISEKLDAIRAAATLANALQDIYNDVGEVHQVRTAYLKVESIVADYAGLQDVKS